MQLRYFQSHLPQSRIEECDFICWNYIHRRRLKLLGERSCNFYTARDSN
jgi:hypothetical protein